jgi:hypothetical protein
MQITYFRLLMGRGPGYDRATVILRPYLPVAGSAAAPVPTPLRIKSPLLSSMIPRHYLRLRACTSEDMSLTCELPYQIMTAAIGLYRRIRASTEQAPNRIGLDH